MSREESRWTYAMGSRPEGVIIYDGGAKLHSHHDTDVARGQHNAFDLVRLHKFGDLDGKADEDALMRCPFGGHDGRLAHLAAASPLRLLSRTARNSSPATQFGQLSLIAIIRPTR